MYMNKPSVTKIEAADRVNLCILLAAGWEVRILKTWPNVCVIAQTCAIS